MELANLNVVPRKWQLKDGSTDSFRNSKTESTKAPSWLPLPLNRYLLMKNKLRVQSEKSLKHRNPSCCIQCQQGLHHGMISVGARDWCFWSTNIWGRSRLLCFWRENGSDRCKIPHGSEVTDIIDGSNVNTTTVLFIWPSTRNINQKHTGQSLSPIVAKLKIYGVSP